MHASWLKWKLYIRWKNQWGKFINKSNKLGQSISIVGWGLDLIQAILYFSMSCAVLKLVIMNKDISNISINSPYIVYGLQKISQIQQNENLIWWIYFFLLIIFSFIVGIKASKWRLNSNDPEWLKLHLNIKNHVIDNLIFFETIFWELKTLTIRIITLLVSVCVVTNQGIFQTVNIIIFSLSFYVLFSLMTSYVHFGINIYKINIKSKIQIVTLLVLRRVIYVYIGYSLTTLFSPWIAKYPFLSKGINPEELNQWFFEGFESFFNAISGILSKAWMPYVFLTQMIEKNLIFVGIFVNLTALISLCIFYKLLLEYGNTKKSKSRINNGIFLEKLFDLLFNNYLFSRKIILLKTFYKSPYLISKLSYLIGDVIYWVTVGLFAGLLFNFEFHDKIYQLILLFLLVFHIYFFSERYFKDLSGILALESDGFNVLIYLNANRNLWYVFKQKFFLYLIGIVPVVITGDIVIWLVGKVALNDILSIFIIHGIGIVSFGLLNYLPSVFFPHFEYLNFEEINEFGDKKMVDSITSNLILIVLIPVISLPTIVYILDYPLKEIINNTLIVFVILFIISIIITWFIKRRLNKHNYIF
ncbi:hypothetical protein ACVAMH_31735 [Bacillus zanthoxyli]